MRLFPMCKLNNSDSPGKLIAPEHTQTAAINAAARLRVIRIGYEKGSVIALRERKTEKLIKNSVRRKRWHNNTIDRIHTQYRSSDITHKFNMEAVLNSTSRDRQISEKKEKLKKIL